MVCEEARYFSELGNEVLLLASDYDPSVARDYGVPEGVDVILSSGSISGDVAKVRSIVEKYDIDIFYPHSFTKRLFLANSLLSDQVPYIPHIHGSVFWFIDEPNRLPYIGDTGFRELVSMVPGHGEFYQESTPSIATRVRASVSQYIERHGLQEADYVTTGSWQVQQELQTLYDIEATVVRPGVSESWINKYESVETRALSEHEHTILSVSRLDSRKRVDLLIEAIVKLRANNYDIGLVIVGEGDERADLQHLASSLNVASAITFEGYVPETKLSSYYKSADVFACPGWMSYGITPLEAYAMRTPVAVSSDAFVHEVLDQSPGVKVIPPSVDAWVSKLPELLDANPNDLDPSIVPTWDEFCNSIHELSENIWASQ
ncbi:glycosyltransferase family 4 protein [Halomicroarcula limicola]|uniref:Glycosyltransferase family 4 protein n=1 Tax=Haloarcula limicola TaxID=1429915 RepID=A0A8J8C4E1_9EURY|nr:glycosyltransferase family 4 protein [Halomicroarcula limicola]